MREKVKLFSERLSRADVGLFLYAGLGLQVSGKNYLVPVDAKLNAVSDLDFGAMDLDVVLRNMEQAAPTNIVFLDACRVIPLLKTSPDRWERDRAKFRTAWRASSRASAR